LTTVAGGTPLGTAQKQTVLNGIGGTINGSTGTTYTFPSSITEGSYFLIWTCQGTAAATTVPLIAAATTMFNVVTMWSSNAAPDAVGVAASTNAINNARIFIVVLITLVNQPVLPVVVTYGVVGTCPTAPCFGDLVVTEANSGLIGVFSDPEENRFREIAQAEFERLTAKLKEQEYEEESRQEAERRRLARERFSQ